MFFLKGSKTRRGRPHRYQTLHQLAPPICKFFFIKYVSKGVRTNRQTKPEQSLEIGVPYIALSKKMVRKWLFKNCTYRRP